MHIQTLLLGGAAPREDADFLYSPGGEFGGEAGLLLHAVGISSAGKAVEAVHAEFQGAGFFLTHLLECPVEQHVASEGRTGSAARDPAILLTEHLPSVASRIRRSLKPRRVILVTEVPPGVVQDILSMNLGCPVVLDDGRPFRFSPSTEGMGISRFQEVLSEAERRPER